MSTRAPEPPPPPAGAAGPAGALEIGAYRNYLLFLARGELSPRLRVRQDPSDIVNQTLLDAHRDRDLFRGSTGAELAAWLREILTHNIVRAARDETRQKRDVRREVPIWGKVEESSVLLIGALVDGRSSPSQQADRNESLLRLAGALASLPEAQREAIELRYFHRWPVKEIADHLGRTTAAVGGLLHRGLDELQRLLSGQPG